MKTLNPRLFDGFGNCWILEKWHFLWHFKGKTQPTTFFHCLLPISGHERLALIKFYSPNSCLGNAHRNKKTYIRHKKEIKKAYIIYNFSFTCSFKIWNFKIG